MLFFTRMFETVDNGLANNNQTYETTMSSFGTRREPGYGMKHDDSGNTLGNKGKYFRRYNWTEIERVDVTDLQMQLKGLKPFTQYEILLQAFNKYGRGPVAKIEAFTAGDGNISKGIVLCSVSLLSTFSHPLFIFMPCYIEFFFFQFHPGFPKT